MPVLAASRSDEADTHAYAYREMLAGLVLRSHGDRLPTLHIDIVVLDDNLACLQNERLGIERDLYCVRVTVGLLLRIVVGAPLGLADVQLNIGNAERPVAAVDES